MKRLYLGNLSYDTRKEDIVDAFRPLAVINSVEIITDKDSGRSKGFAFVEVASGAEAIVSMWNGKELVGREIKVNVARPMVKREPRRDGLNRWGDWALPPFDYNDDPPVVEFLCDRPIIEISSRVSKELMRHILANPKALKKIDHRRFEELVAEIWSGFGYTVELTKRTHDGGMDVIAISKDIDKRRYLIECKRPEPGKCVGIRPVRELYGVFESERATKAFLATTAHFSKEAIVFFDKHKWQLEGKDFEGLMEWINEYMRLKTMPGRKRRSEW